MCPGIESFTISINRQNIILSISIRFMNRICCKGVCGIYFFLQLRDPQLQKCWCLLFNRIWEACADWCAWTCQRTSSQSCPPRSAAWSPSLTCCSHRTIWTPCLTASVSHLVYCQCWCEIWSCTSDLLLFVLWCFLYLNYAVFCEHLNLITCLGAASLCMHWRENIYARFITTILPSSGILFLWP